MRRIHVVVLAVGALWASQVHAQGLRTLSANRTPTASTTVCDTNIPQPRALPPAGSEPVVFLIAPCLTSHGAHQPVPDAYLQDIQLKPSRPSQGVWTRFDAAAEQTVFADFERLWKNHALQDLSVDVRDYQFSNGVIGKLVIYNIMEN